jgi:hypothetical protein
VYTIAVYGQKRSTFILSASQSKYPILPLSSGLPLKSSQEAYDTKLYKFTNDQGSPQDIRIRISVRAGKCDLYVNTYTENDDAQAINQRLPTTKR